MSKYLQFTIQFFIALLAMVYIGRWLDKKLMLPIALFIWVLPLLIIFAIIYKLAKENPNH